MQIQNINSINMKGHGSDSGFSINAKNTGYVAVGGLTLATLASFSKNKTLHKSHKYFGLVALIAMIAHYLKVTGRGGRKVNGKLKMEN